MTADFDVRYARAADDVFLTYRLFGRATPDVLFLPASYNHVGVMTEYEPAAQA